MYIGNYKNKKITLFATNMTAGNTAIIVDQAIQQGAKYFFKLGTFGALQDKIKIGDIYLITGAVRSEGLTDAYASIYYPAISDFELTKLCSETAQKQKIKLGYGIVHSVNIYSPYYSETYNQDKYSLEIYRKLNVIGVEMETSSVFVCCGVKNVKSAAILLCNRDWKTQRDFIKGKRVDWKKHKTDVIMKRQYDKAIDLILEGVSKIK